MSTSFSDPATGWSFECTTESGSAPPAGGIVLSNIRHRSNNFAREVRMIGIRLLIAEVEPSGTVLSRTSLLVVLGPSTFTVGSLQELKPSETAAPAVAGAGGTFLDRLKAAADELVMLKSYFKDSSGNYSGYGLRADYTSNATLLERWSNCEISGLNVSQVFLFSNYGKSPPHEPGTVLMAARCHPLTIYKMIPNGAVDKSKNFQRIESIRFDYRLHLAIDSVPGTANGAPTPKLNNAGLFRDNDEISLSGGASGVLKGSLAAAGSKAAFAAVEKPLVLEVTAPGLVQGISSFKDASGDHWCWDNVHWWGNRGSGPMISTPGAFHAAHMHWRWGSAGSSLRSTIPVIDTTGRPAGLAANTAIKGSAYGSLLVDPRIWIQSIRVAVTENDAALDPTKPGATFSGLSKVDWKTLFTGLRATPRDIAAGADIVCWYSAEVHRELTVPSWSEFTPPNTTTHPPVTHTNKLEGTVFLHGLFFAHEPEITGFGIGDTGAQYWPSSASSIRSAEKWFRDAN
jgi:hypothetical protein